jgi:adenylate cyclase
MTLFFAACGLVALVLMGLLLYRERCRNVWLRTRLDAAAADLERMQVACSRLAPAGVVQRLVSDGSAAALTAPERKEVTVLFADLVGYTEISEQLEPAVLSRMLNGYFQCMSDAIHANGGHVAKFLGDGILAHFGALQSNPWQCDDAVRAALAMRAAMIEYNAELAGEGLGPLALSIGIHRGLGLVGLVGSRERMDYDFIGHTVNLAARVEALTRVHQVDILVTEAVRTGLDKRVVLEAMPAHPVKGIAEPVVTYAVRGSETPHLAAGEERDVAVLDADAHPRDPGIEKIARMRG